MAISIAVTVGDIADRLSRERGGFRSTLRRISRGYMGRQDGDPRIFQAYFRETPIFS
jgi:hypothetical protein